MNIQKEITSRKQGFIFIALLTAIYGIWTNAEGTLKFVLIILLMASIILNNIEEKKQIIRQETAEPFSWLKGDKE